MAVVDGVCLADDADSVMLAESLGVMDVEAFDLIPAPDDAPALLVVLTDVTGATLPVIDPGPNTVGGDELVHPATAMSPTTATTVTDARLVPRNQRITLLPDGAPPLASGTPSTTDRADTLTTCDDLRPCPNPALWTTASHVLRHNGHRAPLGPRSSLRHPDIR